MWHTQVVRGANLAEHRAVAAHGFKLRLEHDFQNRASVAHKLVSGKSASQAVVPPAIALEHRASQATEWQ